MSQTVPEHINKMDWRLNNLTWTTAPFTVPTISNLVPAGGAVTEAALIQLGKERVGITIPNATALFLGLSQMYRVEAEQRLKKCLSSRDKFGQLPDSDSFVLPRRE